MTVVRVGEVFPGTVHEAERCWYDTAGWAAWVDGLAEIIEVTGEWPQPGATVTWQSGPAGRGRVVERCVAYEPLSGQTVEVQDGSVTGRQEVRFTPAGDDVHVELSLDYAIRKRSLVTPLVDLLFIRRAMAMSMRSTLARFGTHLAAARSGGPL